MITEVSPSMDRTDPSITLIPWAELRHDEA